VSFDGKRIKAAAAQAGLSLTELASKMSISRATLYAYVANTINPPEERILELAALTACSPEFFLKRPDAQAVMSQVDASLRLIEAMLSSADPRAALEVLDTVRREIPPDRRGDFLLRLGNGLVMEGSYEEAIGHLMRALSEFREAQERHSTGRVHQSLGFCYANIGPLERAQASFHEAELLLDDADKWKARVALAVVLERRGDFDGALSLVDRARRSSSSPHTHLYCRGVRSNILASLGLWAEVLAEEVDLLAEAEILGATDQIAERLIYAAAAAIFTGDQSIEFRVAQALGFLQAAGDKSRYAFFLTVRSLHDLAQGRLAGARKHAMNAMSLAIKGKYRRAELGAYLRLAEVALAEERFDEASLTLFKASAYAESYEYAAELDYANVLLHHISARIGGGTPAPPVQPQEERRRGPIVSALAEESASILPDQIWTPNALMAKVAARGIVFLPGFTRTSDHPKD